MICEAYDLYTEAGEAVRPPPHVMLKLLGIFFPPKRT